MYQRINSIFSPGTSGAGGDINSGHNVYAVNDITSGRNMYASGTMSASNKQFRIDHPLDPKNKYLNHASIETNEMKNLYDGIVALDEVGTAVITLPDWFSYLNQEFRYQLTCIGGFAPVYISEEYKNNQFKIAGGVKGMKVSWQVTGIRKDPWAEAHKVIVEEDKAEKDKGTCIHPEACQ